ncbi:Fur family transcriptional regulator [Devosia naphthalenivorans]|uniref:Fur family transcriptional regulator n=1 Tax=Devosia naphthalenivorans TaxID=2082392 RepID=UPI001FEAE1E6|nr:transcriptional repressor [Devosia naphthalenivorans]
MDALTRTCRERGLRSTGNLTAVLTALATTGSHLDIEGVRDTVRSGGRSISLASLYRVLAQLTRIGVVETRHFVNGRSRYELAASPEHDHLVDLESGKILEFTDNALNALEEEIAAGLGYRIVRRRRILYVVPIADEQSSVAIAGDAADASGLRS